VYAYRTTELSTEEKETINLTLLIAYGQSFPVKSRILLNAIADIDLFCSVGATFFVKRDDHGRHIFALATSLILRSRVIRSDSLGYLIGPWSLSVGPSPKLVSFFVAKLDHVHSSLLDLSLRLA
jgi:hypothetical protein